MFGWKELEEVKTLPRALTITATNDEGEEMVLRVGPLKNITIEEVWNLEEQTRITFRNMFEYPEGAIELDTKIDAYEELK